MKMVIHFSVFLFTLVFAGVCWMRRLDSSGAQFANHFSEQSPLFKLIESDCRFIQNDSTDFLVPSYLHVLLVIAHPDDESSKLSLHMSLADTTM